MVYYRVIKNIIPLLCCCLLSCNSKEKTGKSEKDLPLIQSESSIVSQNHSTAEVRRIKVNNIGPLYKVFNDSNYLQLEAARNLGIDPISDLNTAYFMKRPIVKVESNQYFYIDSLRHSIPYLVPEAALLLEEIGKNFIDSLNIRGGDSYKIKVTSLLRTPENVGRLRRVNVNATDSSTHQFATTFDISYTNFYCLDDSRQINQGDLKNLLAEVLKDLRDKGKCHVKYEFKTGCFHITVAQ